MVAAGGNGVGDVGVNPLGLGGDAGGELCDAVRCGRRRIGELVEAEGPCHEAQGDLLSVHPVGAGIGGIVFHPVLDELPEGLGVFFIFGSSVRADEGADEGEAVRFPDEFGVYG